MKSFLSSICGEISVTAQSDEWNFSAEVFTPENGVEEWQLVLESKAAITAPLFQLEFRFPQKDMHHVWTPGRTQTLFPPNWGAWGISDIAAWMPLYQINDGLDHNRLTLACQEAKRRVDIQLGIREEGCLVQGTIVFFRGGEPIPRRYETRVRIDSRPIFWSDAVTDASKWISSVQNIPPLTPPQAAYQPLYSSWYAFHQDVHDKDIEEECKIAADLGMKVLIVDDGWQTEDTNRGYAFCGDWEIAKSRFPDMKSHVAKVHQTGLKYMMWYAVPFIGVNSKNYSRFKNKYLSDSGLGAAVLDPRFPDVRDFVASTYEKALKEWNLDGFKLDFIDSFHKDVKDDPVTTEGMGERDIREIPEAVDVMMTDVARRLRAIKPDILIEFRQAYMGPVIRKFGNMLRVGDCPGDKLRNRIGIAHLRLTSGNTAVHADMLEWNEGETPETAARPIIDCLFGTIQYSVMLRNMPPEHLGVIRNWIKFTVKHETTLLHSAFRPHHPEAGYPVIEAESDDERIIAVYLPDTVVTCGRIDKPVHIINGTGESRVILRLENKPNKVLAYDALGNPVTAPEIVVGLQEIVMPVSGRLELLQ